MKLRRKKQSELSTRQRLHRDNSEISRPVSRTFTYRSNRSDDMLNTGRQLQREAIKQSTKGLSYGLQRFGLVILSLAVIVSVINVLSLSANPKIVVLTAANNKSSLRPPSEYQQFASQLFANSVWNHNKLTLNTSNINQQMVNQFAELDSVSVTVPLLAHRPIVYVQPSQPALIMTTDNGVFLVSQSGKALVRANSPDEIKQNLPVINDQSGLRLQLSRQALPADSVKFIQDVIAQLAAKQLTVSAITLPANTSELDIQLVGQTYTVKFNLHNSDKARQQAGTFLAAIDYLQKQNVTPGKYVDVRVDGRAYYQ